MAERLAEHLRGPRPDCTHRHDEAALSRLRDPHPLDLAAGRHRRRRRASASSRARLLDRALRDRPGPLRLVGVGVSGLAEHAQLELTLTRAADGPQRLDARSRTTGIDLMNPLPAAKLDEVLDLLALEPGARVIDLGCGKGELLRRLAARYEIRGVGVDRSPSLLEEARAARAGRRHVHRRRPDRVLDRRAVRPRRVARRQRRRLPRRRSRGSPATSARAGSRCSARATGAASPTRRTSRRSARPATRWPTTPACSPPRPRLGLEPRYAVTASTDDFDRYEWRWSLNGERYAAAHPGRAGRRGVPRLDPQRPPPLRRARRPRDARLRALPVRARRVARAVEGFNFATEIRVRFAETDAQGVAHNSNYFVWFEVARIDYLERHAGGYQRLRDEGIESLVLESHARFLAPARVRRPAARERALSRRARRALPLRVRDHRDGDDDRRRLDGHGTVDAMTLRPTRIPAWLVEASLLRRLRPRRRDGRVVRSSAVSVAASRRLAASASSSARSGRSSAPPRSSRPTSSRRGACRSPSRRCGARTCLRRDAVRLDDARARARSSRRAASRPARARRR